MLHKHHRQHTTYTKHYPHTTQQKIKTHGPNTQHNSLNCNSQSGKKYLLDANTSHTTTTKLRPPTRQKTINLKKSTISNHTLFKQSARRRAALLKEHYHEVTRHPTSTQHSWRKTEPVSELSKVDSTSALEPLGRVLSWTKLVTFNGATTAESWASVTQTTSTKKQITFVFCGEENKNNRNYTKLPNNVGMRSQ